MLIDPQRFNLYAYARNNPLAWVDPSGERLFLYGNTDWLLKNVLFLLAGGEDTFYEYFHVDESGEVVLNEGVSIEDLHDSGLLMIYDLVTSSDNYVYFAGISGADAAKLFQGVLNKKGNLNGHGKDLAKDFTCSGGRTTACGTLVGTSGRAGSLQPANLTNGDPVFAVIAYNTGTVQTQSGIDYGEAAGYHVAYVDPDLVAAEAQGLNQVIKPVSLFIHESEENLAFRMQLNDFGRTINYPSAHEFAIDMELLIRRELKIGGGFAGAIVKSTIPH